MVQMLELLRKDLCFVVGHKILGCLYVVMDLNNMMLVVCGLLVGLVQKFLGLGY